MNFKLLSFVLVVLCLFTTTVFSYDTGHHADLVRNTLPFFGFNNYSADVVVITNWMVDYFSYTLFSPIEELNSLHFDNLNSLRNVSNYWNTLAINTRAAVQAAVRANDTLLFLGLLGMSTHAVQDFYTHSGWVDFHQSSCDCYRDDTWFSVLSSVNGSVLLLQPYIQALSTYSSVSGPCDPYEPNCFPGRVFHGDYCGGINKDSYTRPKWEASYSFAFSGTWEWVFNFLIWADQATNPGLYANTDFSTTQTLPGTSAFVQNAKNYIPQGNDADDLTSDVRSSIIVSYALRQPTAKTGDLQDGHWKGPGTGSLVRLAASTLSFEARKSVYYQLFQTRRIYQNITTPNVYFDVIGDDKYPEVYEFFVPYYSVNYALRNFTKLKVRTTSVSVRNMIITPSVYALIVIGDQTFLEAIQSNENDFLPHWTSVKFVYANTSTVNMSYQLWNDQFPTSDSKYTLNSGNGGDIGISMNVYSHVLTFDGSSGLRSGVYDRINNTVNVSYGSSTEIKFYITQQQQGGDCELDVEEMWGNMFCPDEAYTEYLLHPVCGENETNASGAERAQMSWLKIVIDFLF